MATQITRIDGNNVGFYLDGVTTADVFSLNLVTGDVASAYLSDLDLLVLKTGAENLFSFVPQAARAASALQILTRIVAISSVDAGSYVPSAVTVGSVATLRVTGPSGGRFSIYIPHSLSGTLAGASSGGAGAALFKKEVYDVTAATMINAAIMGNPTSPNVGYPSALVDPAIKIFAVAGEILNAQPTSTAGICPIFQVYLYDPPRFPSPYPSWGNLYFSSTTVGATQANTTPGGLLGNWTNPFISVQSTTPAYSTLDFTTLINNGFVMRITFTYFED